MPQRVTPPPRIYPRPPDLWHLPLGAGRRMAYRVLGRPDCGSLQTGKRADIAIWARNPRKNAAALEELGELGTGRVIALACEVTEEAAIARAMATTLDTLGRVHVCFANAARMRRCHRTFFGRTASIYSFRLQRRDQKHFGPSGCALWLHRQSVARHR